MLVWLCAASILLFFVAWDTGARSVVESHDNAPILATIDTNPHFTELQSVQSDSVVDKSIAIEVRRFRALIDHQISEIEASMLFVQQLLSLQTLDDHSLVLFEATFPRYALINAISRKIVTEIEDVLWKTRITTAFSIENDLTFSRVISLVKCWLKLCHTMVDLTRRCQKLVDLQSKLYNHLGEIVDVLTLLPSEYPNVYTMVKDACSASIVHMSDLIDGLQEIVLELQRQAELTTEVLIEEL